MSCDRNALAIQAMAIAPAKGDIRTKAVTRSVSAPDKIAAEFFPTNSTEGRRIGRTSVVLQTLNIPFCNKTLRSDLERKRSPDCSHVNRIVIFIVFGIGNDQHSWSNANIFGNLEAIESF